MYLFLCLCDDFACLFNVSLKQSHQGRYVSYKIVPTTLMPEENYCTVNYSFRIKFYCLEMQNTFLTTSLPEDRHQQQGK